jgi:hypothetical protein
MLMKRLNIEIFNSSIQEDVKREDVRREESGMNREVRGVRGRGERMNLETGSFGWIPADDVRG